MVLYSRFFLRLISSRTLPISGIALFPFIILDRKLKGSSGVEFVINHERIHLRQQAELLLVFFALWYFLSYLKGRYKGKQHDEAYRDKIGRASCRERV